MPRKSQRKPASSKPPRQPRDLKQAPETWGVGAALLRTWIVPEDEPPSRPNVTLVLDLTNGCVLGHDLMEAAAAPEDVRRTLLKAMTKPEKGCGRARRPERVLFADEALTTALTPALAEIGVTCETQELPMLPEIIRELESFMRDGEPEHPGLLSVTGVTPEMAGGFFAAAAEFYREAPWVHLLNEQSFRLRFPAEGGASRIVIVMGNAGVEYGLAVYEKWADVEKMYLGVGDPSEALPPQGALTLFYENVEHLPFDDLEAMQRYSWEVADEQAYPLPAYFTSEGGFRRPTPAELSWLEAALRAIPRLLRDHLRPDGQGDYQPLEATLKVPTHRGEVLIHAKYPAGVIAREKLAAQRDDWIFEGEEDEVEAAPPAFDRRAMEGMLAGIPGVAQPGDKKLRKAQEMMYRAFDEANPAKRISLAHKALATSPNCADAYVLLAEEEADTVARALGYYQKAVEAGERALGPDYFQHEAGYFWGILETRPYMRARFGLASSLWRLGRRDEAAAHFRDMLRLNEGDNQGVRYLLAGLLLEMDRDAELLKLLKQYKDDWSSVWTYTWALVEFRQSGPGKKADSRLKQALKQNAHVPAYLTGQKRIPNRMPDYIGVGDEREAAAYAGDHLNHWRRTAGAVAWLKSKL
ncbi:MAG TPA: hypothetical protein VI793_08005 [Anaerolineales bacterium]|nr:hypothetical protein [Anaerolineales bacterium]